MLFAAARIGDPLTHDTLVPSGLIGPPLTGPAPGKLVLIEGLPGAYVTCSAVCVGTLSAGVAHPPPPGPPPPVVGGSLTVFTNNLLASRWFPSGDVAGCAAFLGDPKLLPMRRVFIGGASSSLRSVTTGLTGGLFGAVVGGILGALGGAIAGFLVGGPAGALMGAISGAVAGAAIGYSMTAQEVTRFGDSIVIEGTPEYRAKVVRDLRIIEGTPSGQRLLASMERSGQTMRIHTDDGNGNWAWTDPAPSGSNPPGYLRGDGTPGDPANTEVGYNPDRTSLSGPPGSPINSAAWAQSPNRPADVGLFHEMVHGDDMMHGRMDGTQGTNVGPRAGTPISNFELRAAGLGPHSGETYSENTYRDDRGLPQRTFY